MTTLTGILEWPQRAEGRVRQMKGDAIIKDEANDPYVPVAFGDQYKLRSGLEVTVQVVSKKPRRRRGKPNSQRKARPVVEAFVAIEGRDPNTFNEAPAFEDLTVIDPEPRLTLEFEGCAVANRLIDLFCPIGRGQRALIVSPPKAGKTTLLKNIVEGVHRNHPEVEIIGLLIDERPEEVTDFKRSFKKLDEAVGDTPGEGRLKIIASSNDMDTERHVQVAMVCLERCKRMVEAGKHVMVVLDSLTRLGRAFNQSRQHASSGRTMSGGLDSKALEVPRQLFGAARNTEEAGSLTIVATCLVDTGSQADQIIFEEFKGSGNMELILDRKIAERRLFPAINLAASGTRKEDKLLDPATLTTMNALRRRLLNMPPPQQVEQLLLAMDKFKTNEELVHGPKAAARA